VYISKHINLIKIAFPIFVAFLLSGCDGANVGNASAQTTSTALRLTIVEQSVHPLAFSVVARNFVPLPVFPAVQTMHGTTLLLNSTVRQDSTSGALIGVMHGVCTNVGSSRSVAPGQNQDLGSFMMQCTHTIRIDGVGTLVITGFGNTLEFEGTPETCFTNSGIQRLAITGGTGAYNRARGEATITALHAPGCGFVGCPNPAICRPGPTKQIVLDIL